MIRCHPPAPPYPPDWYDIAEAVRYAAAWHCQDCGKEGLTPADYSTWDSPENRPRMLQVHHLDRNPANCANDNLVCLCQRCHQRRHRQLRQQDHDAHNARLPESDQVLPHG